MMEKPQGRTRRLALALIGLAILVLAIGFLVFKYLSRPSAAAKPDAAPAATAQPRPEPAKVEPPAPEPAKAEPPAPEPVAAAPAPEPKPAAEPKAPAPAKQKAVKFKKPGVTYKIKWGDTLWDLSYAYYRDPWVYMRIAKANKIKNPDLIISGRKLWIPAK
jgi:nucleoid-associated protein YgaU